VALFQCTVEKRKNNDTPPEHIGDPAGSSVRSASLDILRSPEMAWALGPGINGTEGTTKSLAAESRSHIPNRFEKQSVTFPMAWKKLRRRFPWF
jgi:hypothetical protein